jgi:hypothetical protein
MKYTSAMPENQPGAPGVPGHRIGPIAGLQTSQSQLLARALLTLPLSRAATYVDRILHREKPGDLPVQLPLKCEMAVNLKTAKALGLAIPPSIMLRADEVIE